MINKCSQFFCIVVILTTSLIGVKLSAQEDFVVATLKGEKIQLSALKTENALEIYEAEKALFDLRMTNLRNLLIGKLIRLDPKSKGLSDDQYIKQFVAQSKPVSDELVDAFIQQRQIPQSKINANLKGQVRRFMMSQHIAMQVDQWFEAEGIKHNMQVNLAKPEEPRFHVTIKNAAYRGGKNAPVTIVEFSDFQCPYCTRANQTLAQLSDLYGDKIKIVFKHFPLSSIHPEAAKASEASICAQEQGMDKFWLLHDEMFSNQRNLSVGIIKDQAKKLGLETESFNQCLMSGKHAAKVEADLQEGLKLGVSSTPAFYVNGRFIKGAQPIEIFKAMIDEELSE